MTTFVLLLGPVEDAGRGLCNLIAVDGYPGSLAVGVPTTWGDYLDGGQAAFNAAADYYRPLRRVDLVLQPTLCNLKRATHRYQLVEQAFADRHGRPDCSDRLSSAEAAGNLGAGVRVVNLTGYVANVHGEMIPADGGLYPPRNPLS